MAGSCHSLLAGFLLLPLLTQPAAARQGGDWFGSATYTFRRELLRQSDQPDALKHTRLHVAELEQRTARVMVCGAGPLQMRSFVSSQISILRHDEATEASESCRGPDGQPYTKRPGNGRANHWERTGGASASELQDPGVGFLVWPEDSTFAFSVRGMIPEVYHDQTLQEWIWACEGRTEEFPSEVEGRQVWSVDFAVEGRIQDGRSTGRKVLAEDITAESSLLAQVEWFVASPCGRMESQLAKALTLAAFYGDPQRQAAASSAEELNRQVDEATGATVDAWVDPADCLLKDYETDEPMTPQEFRRRLAEGEYLCSPDPVLDSLVEHELTHVRQCRADEGGGYSDPTPASLGKAEWEAYCTEARVLLDGLQACGGAGPEARSRYQAVCGAS